MNRIGRFVFAAAVFFLCPCFAALNGPNADLLLDAFSRERGECAVVVLNARSGKIEYLYNRDGAVNRRYPPGSVAKGWSAAVLLDGRGFDPDRKVTCDGRFIPPSSSAFCPGDESVFNLVSDTVSGENYFKCSVLKGHGLTDLRKALIKSCNVYFLTQAAQCPGFYEKLVTVWRLDDQLLPGTEPSPEVRLMRGSPFCETASAVGEGGLVLVSPLKTAQCYAALFENTPLLQPYEGTGSPSVRQDLSVSEEARLLVRSSLARTVTEGTLSKLSVPGGVRILAGKTGTATRRGKKYARHGWNVLWVEVGGERYVVVGFVLTGSGPKEAVELSSAVCKGLWGMDEKN